MTEDRLSDLLFSGGTALAGLILVFLGQVVASFESFEAVDRSAVREKHQRRAWLGFSGFAAALLAAVTGLLASVTPVCSKSTRNFLGCCPKTNSNNATGYCTSAI